MLRDCSAIIAQFYKMIEEGILYVTYRSNLSGRANTYRKGAVTFDSNTKTPLFHGEYGTTLNENQEIENPTVIFTFKRE